MKKWTKVALIAVLSILFTGCASCSRAAKDWSSEMSGGLKRSVEVYTYDGKLLKTYKGNIDFDANTDGGKVKFDLDGKRVILYNAVVITEEE
ncbi:hypothetical protein [Tumebacillus flagellatus]|uniref:DUF5052 domain-containing protein n=1 Tax=Tumebacillus flagellatus TaxID=1157490 RepID=A0A074LW31_9BACL|nr:hypothetical protein [Tumebacillus flagellatus]KEO84790.1 hypothetical protein EL26_01915 [Tumebacillus flagellatus]